MEGAVKAQELLHNTQSTESSDDEEVITILPLPSPNDTKIKPLAIGTRKGIVKRWMEILPQRWILGQSLI